VKFDDKDDFNLRIVFMCLLMVWLTAVVYCGFPIWAMPVGGVVVVIACLATCAICRRMSE